LAKALQNLAKAIKKMGALKIQGTQIFDFI